MHGTIYCLRLIGVVSVLGNLSVECLRPAGPLGIE